MSRWLALVAAVCSLFAAPPVEAASTAEQLLQAVGFSERDHRDVFKGEIVNAKLPRVSDRDLTVANAFLVRVAPQELVEAIQRGVLLDMDMHVLTHGPIQGAGSLEQFQGLELPADLRDRFRDVGPGRKLNLSASEIESFQAESDESVEERVSKLLLGRYRAYRAQGLAGIAPYLRKRNQSEMAAPDLERAVHAASYLEDSAPSFLKSLLDYPKGEGRFDERFSWVIYNVYGTPQAFLTHTFSQAVSDAYVVSRRHFYVSGGLNSEQGIAVLLPVPQGTLVTYVNRTFTNQVTGFGAGWKRSLGNRFMANRLRSLFTQFNDVAAPPPPEDL